MGDSEIIVAQTNVVMGYASSAAYITTDYSGLSSNTIQEATTENSAPLADPTHPMPGDGNACSVDFDSVMQQSNSYATYEAQPAAGATHAGGSVVSSRHELMALSQAAVYDPSATGVTTSGLATLSSVEIGDASDCMAGTVDTLQLVYGSAMSAEEARMWNIVRANSFDFNAWSTLIRETENVAEDNIVKIREVYDAFLAEFPLYFKYWKKYADHEAHFSVNDEVGEVYERGIQDDAYSIDFWLHYCTFAASTFGDPDAIRRLFERRLAYVGAEYLSFALWDRYSDCELMQKAWGQLVGIFSLILENPNQRLDRYLISFKELSGSRPLSELRTAKEAAAAASAASKDGVQANGKEAQPDDAEPSPAILTEAEGPEKFVAIQKEICKKAKEAESKIINFEAAIWRRYFHVMPISAAELENWNHYLDFNEREGDFAKRQPEIDLFAAHFKEQSGYLLGALAAYQLVHSDMSPGLLEAIINYANMKCHLRNMKAVYSLFKQAIAAEKERDCSQTLPMLFAQYARFKYLAISLKFLAAEAFPDCLRDLDEAINREKSDVWLSSFSESGKDSDKSYMFPLTRDGVELLDIKKCTREISGSKDMGMSLKFQTKPGQVDSSISSLMFPVGCELHEAFGQAFMNKSNFFDWEAEEIGDRITDEMHVGMSYCQLTSDSCPEHLLEAVVCHSGSHDKSEKSFCQSMQSLLTLKSMQSFQAILQIRLILKIIPLISNLLEERRHSNS